MGRGIISNRLNPFRTAVPFWGQTTRSLTGLSPERDCGSLKGLKAPMIVVGGIYILYVCTTRVNSSIYMPLSQCATHQTHLVVHDLRVEHPAPKLPIQRRFCAGSARRTVVLQNISNLHTWYEAWANSYCCRFCRICGSASRQNELLMCTATGGRTISGDHSKYNQILSV